jgi:hypothetical protein
VAALVLSAIGVGLAVLGALLPGGGSCQSTAWDVEPAITDLPPDWEVGASQYDVLRKSMSVVGPLPADETLAQPVVYATVTCYPEGAGESVTRSADAASAAGQLVEPRDDLGDQGFSSEDESGAAFVQFRHDDVVVYLAASAETLSADLEQIASAMDIALGGDGGAAVTGTPDGGEGEPGASDAGEPGEEVPSDDGTSVESPVVPELESALPGSVGDTQLAKFSAIGTEILGDDAGGRAIAAALRAKGLQLDDLRLAQARDESGESDLYLTAIDVRGMDKAALEPFVIESWLGASGPGIERETVTLGDRQLTRVDYGDAGSMDYVVARDGVVIVISTADAALAEAVAQALP